MADGAGNSLSQFSLLSSTVSQQSSSSNANTASGVYIISSCIMFQILQKEILIACSVMPMYICKNIL